MNRLLLWVAQGFGVGRIPVAPGTFGSLLGLAWFALLLATRNFWLFMAGALVGVVCSVWLCGLAEKTLHQTDPGSVVLDEVVAIPLCFVGWVAVLWVREGRLASLGDFFDARHFWWTLGVFLAFRSFDIAKPWPVRQSQSLPGGWGVTLDDVLAAGYVNLVVLGVLGFKAIF